MTLRLRCNQAAVAAADNPPHTMDKASAMGKLICRWRKINSVATQATQKEKRTSEIKAERFMVRFLTDFYYLYLKNTKKYSIIGSCIKRLDVMIG
jgi:hypothetical protein